MSDYGIFPIINACLNGTSAVLVATARAQIRRGKIAAHRALMIAAVCTSSLFLVSYVWYHTHVPFGSMHFQGQGLSRPLYFTILISHTFLAAAIVPLVIITLTLGLRRRDAKHRAIARWTYPLWIYVSSTGVIIYLMLYHLFRA
jgi:uncharacterized membrane protein YozB (DUF420 family)